MSLTLKDVGEWSPLILSIVKDIGPTEAIVYSIVWNYSQMRGSNCFASIDTIAEKSGISRTTTKRCLKLLVDKGYLSLGKNAKEYSTNTYLVTKKAGIRTVAFDHPIEEVDIENYGD